MRWRTRVGQGRAVEHRSKAAADRAVAEARDGYRRGVRSYRIVRVIDPEGRLTIIDCAREVALEDPLLAAVARLREDRDRARAAVRAADAELEEAIRAAYRAGLPPADIARAAGTTVAQVRAVLNRRR